MAGKVWFLVEEYYSEGLLLDYRQLNKRKDEKFMVKHLCDEVVRNELPSNTREGYNYYCEGGCLCAVYRKHVFKNIRLGNFSKAKKLAKAGFQRMKLDIKEQGFIDWMKYSIGI